MNKVLLALALALSVSSTQAQFDPAGGEPESKGVHWDDARLDRWVTSANAEIGWQKINDTTLGKADAGSLDDVLGKADRRTLSLGDGGQITLEFDPPISNREGDDFVVFENGFQWHGGYFLELAYVEVSSNGSDYVRFPAQYEGDTSIQIWNLAEMECKWYHNLAGKHQAPYGTPFDLDSLENHDSVDINRIRFIRLTDVVGSLADSLRRFDSRGVVLNDPWPTPFANSGFDLDAVGVIGDVSAGIPDLNLQVSVPNPIRVGSSTTAELKWYSTSGQLVTNGYTAPSQSGVYIVEFHIDKSVTRRRICVID